MHHKVHNMSSSKLIVIQVILLLVAMFRIVTNTPLEARASRVSPRHQRQIITEELGTGLTGTGTSFQSFYGGYNNYDPLNTGQQQVLTGGHDYDDQLGKTGRPVWPTTGGSGGYIGSGRYDRVGPSWRGFGQGKYPNRGKVGGVKY